MSDSPTGTPSLATSLTHVLVQDDPNDFHSAPLRVASSESGSAIQDDKVEKKIEDKDDDGWEQDPLNPRNWSPAKKWVATALVS